MTDKRDADKHRPIWEVLDEIGQSAPEGTWPLDEGDATIEQQAAIAKLEEIGRSAPMEEFEQVLMDYESACREYRNSGFLPDKARLAAIDAMEHNKARVLAAHRTALAEIERESGWRVQLAEDSEMHLNMYLASKAAVSRYEEALRKAEEALVYNLAHAATVHITIIDALDAIEALAAGSSKTE